MAENGATKPWRSTCLQECARCKHCSGDTQASFLQTQTDSVNTEYQKQNHQSFTFYSFDGCGKTISPAVPIQWRFAHDVFIEIISILEKNHYVVPVFKKMCLLTANTNKSVGMTSLLSACVWVYVGCEGCSGVLH